LAWALGENVTSADKERVESGEAQISTAIRILDGSFLMVSPRLSPSGHFFGFVAESPQQS
jgi:hypothetical protein